MDKSVQIAAHVREIPKDAEKSRTIPFVISTADKDRHGSVLNMENWQLDAYRDNPVVGYQHNLYGDMCNPPNPDDVIGTSIVRMDGNELIGSVTFEPAEINELAEKVFQKVLHKTLRAASVGFIPVPDAEGKTGELRDGTFHYFGQELLEWSVVNIPSNPRALQRTVEDHTARALMFVRRSLNYDVSFAEIEQMTVRNVLDLLTRKNAPDELRQGVEAAGPDLDEQAAGRDTPLEQTKTNGAPAGPPSPDTKKYLHNEQKTKGTQRAARRDRN